MSRTIRSTSPVNIPPGTKASIWIVASSSGLARYIAGQTTAEQTGNRRIAHTLKKGRGDSPQEHTQFGTPLVMGHNAGHRVQHNCRFISTGNGERERQIVIIAYPRFLFSSTRVALAETTRPRKADTILLHANTRMMTDRAIAACRSGHDDAATS